MKRFSRVVFALLVVPGLLASQAIAKEPGQEGKKIRVLLTVGGHGFEEKPFFAIFDAMPDTQWTKIELPKEADRLTPGLKRDFDVIVMYDMAASFTPRQQKAFIELLNEGNRGRLAPSQHVRTPRLARVPKDHWREVSLHGDYP